MSEHFPELYEHSSENVKAALDLLNNARKSDLKVSNGII